MARRSKKFYVFWSLTGFVALALLFGSLKSGGLKTPLPAPPGTRLATAAEMAGAGCRRQVIPVQLAPGSWLNFDVVGELCSTGELDGKVLQVLVSGSGYGSIYWDFPYQPDTYSYTRAALRAGYATFNFYRLGMGESDHPPGLLLNVDNQAYVLGQIIATLRSTHDYSAVLTVGHSFGSVIAIAHGLTHPDQVAGIVLTGFAHNTNPGFVTAMRTGVDLAAFKGPFAGRLVDPTYLISKPATRGDTFYTRANADPRVIETDELNRQTTAVAEAISASKYFGPQSRGLQVPVLLLLGEDDFVVCGGELNCREHAEAIAHEQAFFSPAACLEVVVLDDTGHDSALHLNAPQNFALMLNWAARRVGTGAGTAPTAPCRPAGKLPA
ncbi:MAG: alpha/beta fold hydrolase [Gammaproteobacteria bacterium]|nr:alpha/beta fold hydrolase [Gammaproteobacteria bacterium]